MKTAVIEKNGELWDLCFEHVRRSFYEVSLSDMMATAFQLRATNVLVVTSDNPRIYSVEPFGSSWVAADTDLSAGKEVLKDVLFSDAKEVLEFVEKNGLGGAYFGR